MRVYSHHAVSWRLTASSRCRLHCEQRFRPISVERPKVLMPLVNVPMLDYTLEWLSSAGVEEVRHSCCAHLPVSCVCEC